jgi:hypothetical protein
VLARLAAGEGVNKVGYGMFWEIHQQRQIGEANQEASRATSKVRSVATELHDLRASLNRMMLINRAFWEIIKDATGLSEEYLAKKVEEIDLRDGVLDGKLTTQVRQCPSCERTLYKAHRHCLYCGAEDPDADPFDAVR